MNKKQTQCPECTTIYKVSVAQLTIAQGMVCCPKCSHSFNGLLNLVEISTAQHLPEAAEPALLHHDYEHEVSDHVLARSYSQQHLLDIFDRKIEQSNIDLHTYLNNLNYFSSDPIYQFPSLKLSERELHVPEKRSLGYYILWSSINLVLVGFLAFQMLWFNPDFVARYPSLNHGLLFACNLIDCQRFEQRYEYIHISQFKITTHAQGQQIFSGILINQDTKSMPLPNLRLRFENDTGSVEYLYLPEDYLESKYQGIERIPSNTPFGFNFRLALPKNQIQNPRLEIVAP